VVAAHHTCSVEALELQENCVILAKTRDQTTTKSERLQSTGDLGLSPASESINNRDLHSRHIRAIGYFAVR